MSKQAEKLNGAAEKVESQFQNIANSLTDIQENVVDTSQQVAKDSIEFVKKYPLHTAIGAGVIGFISGYAYKRFGNKE